MRFNVHLAGKEAGARRWSILKTTSTLYQSQIWLHDRLMSVHESRELEIPILSVRLASLQYSDSPVNLYLDLRCQKS